MIKRLLLYFLREELSDIETMNFNNLQAARATLHESLALSLRGVHGRIDALTAEVNEVRLTAIESRLDVNSMIEAVAAEVDLLGGAVLELENHFLILHEMQDMEMDDLEERIKDLEDNK